MWRNEREDRFDRIGFGINAQTEKNKVGVTGAHVTPQLPK